MARKNKTCPKCGRVTEHIVIRVNDDTVRHICVRCNRSEDEYAPVRHTAQIRK